MRSANAVAILGLEVKASAGCWWLVHVTLTTQEAEIRRIDSVSNEVTWGQ
jgi:hypothetical protein